MEPRPFETTELSLVLVEFLEALGDLGSHILIIRISINSILMYDMAEELSWLF